jgi:uncharacterized protein (DUF305 family)
MLFSIIFPAHLGAATDEGKAVVTKFASICGARLRQENDASFLAAIHISMKKMMAGMSVPPTGSVDVDFVNAMVPHHQGAIDMAEAELRFGANPQLRRIAQEIIVEQQQEITAMRFALGEPLPPSMPSPDQTPPGSGI